MLHKRYLLYSIILLGATPILCLGYDTYFTMQSVQRIEERLYLVKRLESPVDALFKIYAMVAPAVLQKQGRLFGTLGDHKQNFQHKATCKALEEISEVSSIDPFRKIWCSLLSYRYLEDKEFEQEAIKLLLLLYQDLFKNLGSLSITLKDAHKVLGNQKIDEIGLSGYSHQKKQKRFITQEVFSGLGTKPDQDIATLLATGHYTADCICAHADCDTVNDTLNSLERVLHEPCSNDDIVINNVLRFYHMQRLVRPMFMLSKKHELLVADELVIPKVFKHELILECIDTLKSTGSSKGFFKLWKRLATYDFIEDKQLLNEFVQLTLVLYRHLLEKALQEPRRFRIIVNDTMLVNDKIASLPLAELLNVLDTIVDQYEEIVATYELNNESLSWKAWFEKYWWAPPVILTTCYMVLLKSYYKLSSLIVKKDV